MRILHRLMLILARSFPSPFFFTAPPTSPRDKALSQHAAVHFPRLSLQSPCDLISLTDCGAPGESLSLSLSCSLALATVPTSPQVCAACDKLVLASCCRAVRLPVGWPLHTHRHLHTHKHKKKMPKCSKSARTQVGGGVTVIGGDVSSHEMQLQNKK